MKSLKKKAFIALTATSAVAVGAVAVGAEEAIFTDVPDTHPHYAGIQILAEDGIVHGFGDGTFKPENLVTRGQAAKMLAGALELDTENVLDPTFKDLNMSNQYFGAIAALWEEGILIGYDDNTFKPGGNLTHAQALKIFMRVKDFDQEFALTLLDGLAFDYNPSQKITRGELATVVQLLKGPIVEEGYNLNILHVNDTHGRVESFPKLIAAVKEQRDIYPDSLLLHGGDAFSGTLYSNEFLGQADVVFLNAMEVDAMTLGNHEFDYGVSKDGHKALTDFIKAANFPIVTANVDFSADPLFTGLFSDLVSSEPENGKIYMGMVKEVDGEKIGIFGLTTEETKDIAFVGSVKFENYIEEARKAVAAFEGMGVNKIIALTHIGYDDNPAVDNDQILAKTVEGIDIIVGGHTHTQLDAPIVVDTNTLGQAKDKTLIVQANEYAKYLGTLNVTFDEEGKIVGYFGELLDTSKYKDDAEAAELLAPYKEKVDSFSGSEIGVTLTAKLENPRTSSENPTAVSVRNSETILGNIITDGMLSKAKQFTQKKVIMAVQNGGGIRAAIDEGPVTVGEVITVLPFGNVLAIADVTGAELKAAFEVSVKNAPEENGGFLHVAGAKVTYDSSKPSGERVVSIQYLNDAGQYVEIEPATTYTIATNVFTAKGGDGFDMFAKAYAEGRVTDLGLNDWENFREQLVNLKTIPTATEGRIVDVAK